MTAAPSPVWSAAPIGAALLLALTTGLVLIGLVMGLTVLGTAADPFGPVGLVSPATTAAALGIVGALIVIRLPANRIGWLLLGTGPAMSAGYAAAAFEAWSRTLPAPAAGLAAPHSQPHATRTRPMRRVLVMPAAGIARRRASGQ